MPLAMLSTKSLLHCQDQMIRAIVPLTLIPCNLHYIFPFLLTKKTMRYKENMKYLIKLSEYCTGLLLNARFKNGTMQPRCKYAL